ncbi:MAG: lactonase family protein [Solirubrobacterales bacterium]
MATLAAVATLAVAVAAVALAAGPSGSVKQVGGKDGCYTTDGSSASGPGTCRKIRGGEGSTSLAISPGGHFAYLDGYGRDAVVPVLSVFRRSSDGTLHQLPGKAGCFSRDGSSEDGPKTCTEARNLDSGDATSLVVSRDGRFVYVASQLQIMNTDIGGVAIFRRNVKDGTLHQLPGKAGCVSATGGSEDGPGTCTRTRETDDISNVHITPDQKFLYASNYDSPPNSGIAIFKRGARSGRLHQLKGNNGCITDDGTTEQSGSKVVCRKSPNLGEPWDVATPDNRFAYIPAAYGPDLVQAFERNAGGGLVPLTGKHSCVSDDGTSPAGPCVDGRGMNNVERAVLSKNKRFIYTNAYQAPSPVAVLNRNPKTGELSERAGKAACISADGSSKDGPDTCRDGRALSGGYAGILAPNGRTLYYSEYTSNVNGALALFRVSKKTGAFSQLSGKDGCVSADGSSEDGPGTCGKARAIEGAYQVTLGSKGHDVYVAADQGNGVALLRAAP